MLIIDFALNLGGTVGTSAGLFSFSPSGAMSSRSFMCCMPIGFGLAVVDDVEVSLLPNWLPFDVSRLCPSP